MSTRSKRTSRINDSGKKSLKEEISVENSVRRRSLRNNAGTSIVMETSCKKQATSSSTSKQIKNVLNNTVNEIVGTQRNTRTSPRKTDPVLNSVLNSSPKKCSVFIEKLPVRVSPRNAANGNINSNIKKISKRKANKTNKTFKNTEQIEENQTKKKLRMSNRKKRCLSPDPEINLTEASNSQSHQPSKRQCKITKSKKSLKNKSNANGDVTKSIVDLSLITLDDKKCIVTLPLLEMDDPGSTATIAAAEKCSIKRSLPLDPEDSVVDQVNKKLKQDVFTVQTIKPNHKLSKKCIPNNSIELEKKSTLIDQSMNSSSYCTKNHTKQPIQSLEIPEEMAAVVIKSNKEQIYITNESELIFTNKTLEHLFEECKLNESQKKELKSILPLNCTGFSLEELVELLVKVLLEKGLLVNSMTSPRVNKFLRNLLGIYCNSSCSVDKKHYLCENALNWAKERKTVNLTHELELALMNLYYNTQFYKKAEQTATILYNETKKLQDKEKVVQACLCLSQTYHAMGNISKAKANITTAKTEALKIYTAPDLQAELDLQSGIMQIAEEKDMETAFSYFKEAATSFTISPKRSKALKYMLLSKLLINRPEEGEKLVQTQIHLPDVDEGVQALIAITKAAMSSSLEEFKNGLEKYKKELKEDLVVKEVIDKLYTKMLEKNLINIIKPYDKIQISYVANRIGLTREDIERRLSQLILDGQINAQLDHRDDCLYVYETEEADRIYPMALDSMSQLDRTLTHLNKRVKELLL